MPSLDMGTVHEFTRAEILKAVTQVRPGNYALGYLKKNSDGKDGFWVHYVGRSDHDVAERLQQHLKKPYTHFKFCYATSPWKAFLKECQNYHDFGEGKQLDNKIHPDRPDGTDWKCPCCDIFDT